MNPFNFFLNLKIPHERKGNEKGNIKTLKLNKLKMRSGNKR